MLCTIQLDLAMIVGYSQDQRFGDKQEQLRQQLRSLLPEICKTKVT